MPSWSLSSRQFQVYDRDIFHKQMCSFLSRKHREPSLLFKEGYPNSYWDLTYRHWISLDSFLAALKSIVHMLEVINFSWGCLILMWASAMRLEFFVLPFAWWWNARVNMRNFYWIFDGGFRESCADRRLVRQPYPGPCEEPAHSRVLALFALSPPLR